MMNDDDDDDDDVAASISESSVNFYDTTQQNICDDVYLQSRRYEDLESHAFKGNLELFYGKR
jgi:hypothetical protein